MVHAKNKSWFKFNSDMVWQIIINLTSKNNVHNKNESCLSRIYRDKCTFIFFNIYHRLKNITYEFINPFWWTLMNFKQNTIAKDEGEIILALPMGYVKNLSNIWNIILTYFRWLWKETRWKLIFQHYLCHDNLPCLWKKQ